MSTEDSSDKPLGHEPFLVAPNNRQAYAELFTQYAPRVMGYLVRRGLAHAAAEELTQEVMLSVWRKAETYDGSRGAVHTWMFTIARNRYIDELRRSRRVAPDPDDPCWVETVGNVPEPDAEVLGKRLGTQLHNALADLPPEQLAALRNLYFEGKTSNETAEEFNVPVGTVKSRARRALAALRKSLGEGQADEP